MMDDPAAAMEIDTLTAAELELQPPFLQPVLDETLPDLLSNIELDKIYDFSGLENELEDARSTASRPITLHIPESLLTPKSCYEPFEPPCPVISERGALKMLLPKRCDDDDFLELQLDDFAVFCETDHSANVKLQEMRSLHQLDTEQTTKHLYFNGVLSNGTQRAYVRHVRITALPIGNYGHDSKDQTKDNIWIQSADNTKRDIFYKLGTPATEYRRFYEPFFWVADLAKHVVDFLAAMRAAGHRVTIRHFAHDFGRWLYDVYFQSDKRDEVDAWMEQYGRLDFRSAVNANIGFLHKEAMGALGEKDAAFHGLWDEILHFTKYAPYISTAKDDSTIVTRYIYDCFGHLPFGSHLKAMDLAPVTKNLRTALIGQQAAAAHTCFPSQEASNQMSRIRPGDTISTARDHVDSGTPWAKEHAKHDAHPDRWFALVQNVLLDEDGHRSFEVIWYYRPADTLCGLMKYPWPNELFLSTHCSCEESFKIREDEVLGVHDMEFGGSPSTTKEFFCRQAYASEDKIWTSLSTSHLRCTHAAGTGLLDNTSNYCPGDTVLAHLDRSSDICEPCEITIIEKDRGQTRYGLRQLLRRHLIDSTARTARPNELIYTDNSARIGPSRIVGRCHVRWFAVNETVPTPYDREGVGAFFFLTHQMEATTDGPIITPLEQAPPSLRQGYDPRENFVPKLRGLDLFCGGGSFGRGLEEGGAVMMQWANDMDSKAVHTYMANAADPEKVAPFLGSIDDLQRLAIEGRFGAKVPRIGDVDFISGGSPCPGFSLLTNDKTTSSQRKNQSLVAAFASFVDLYRPKYGILENVVGIIQKHRNRDQDVFSQLMCALVGMGYQARLFFLDALSCGSAQIRSRVFIVFAAPGWVLPETPLQTHSYPPSVNNLGLGKLPTGEPMVKRGMAKCTPFRFRSA